jgi:hypothetical protein
MELAIQPEDLSAAAAALLRCSLRLEDAVATFTQRARSDLPDIGADTAEATGRGVVTARREVEIITTDINQVAKALAALTHGYNCIDRTAVARR